MAGHRPSRRPHHDSIHHPTQEDSSQRRPESGSVSGRYSNPNIFSDEFSLEPFDSDDFRRSSSSIISADENTIYQRNASSASTVSMTINRNGEILTSPFDDSASVSQEDVSRPSYVLPKNTSPNRTSSVTTNSTNTTSATATTSNARSVAQRSVSSASHFSIPRALSPYVGDTNPSHPYGMYPQGTAVTRSSSVTTTSTTRPSDRPLVGPTAPQHPYAMYTQNTVPEESAEDASPIPVGFIGHDQTYRRRGHGGEDVGDIVGPDGHMEQLPPYSRYPDGIPPKLGLGHASMASAERNSPPESAPPTSPQSQVSSRTLIEQNETQRATQPPSPPDPGDPEESRFEEKQPSRAKARICCGVPLWMTILIGAVLLVGAVIGGVIGGVLGNEKGEHAGGEMAHSMMTAQ